MSALFPKV